MMPLDLYIVATTLFAGEQSWRRILAAADLWQWSAQRPAI